MLIEKKCDDYQICSQEMNQYSQVIVKASTYCLADSKPVLTVLPVIKKQQADAGIPEFRGISYIV